MKLTFNLNFDFEMSRGELKEIGSMIRSFRERKNERNAKRDNESKTIDIGRDRDPQQRKHVELEKLEARAKTARKIADLMKQVEELKKQLNK